MDRVAVSWDMMFYAVRYVFWRKGWSGERRITIKELIEGVHLLIDLVIELGSSERTRARMDNTVCVNVSGVRGGYMFRYIT